MANPEGLTFEDRGAPIQEAQQPPQSVSGVEFEERDIQRPAEEVPQEERGIIGSAIEFVTGSERRAALPEEYQNLPEISDLISSRREITQRYNPIGAVSRLQAQLDNPETYSSSPIPNAEALRTDFSLTMDSGKRIQAIQNRIPEAQFEQVEGSTIVTIPYQMRNGQRVEEPLTFTLNTPGFSTTDLADIVTTGIQYAPAGRVAGVGQSLLTRSGLGAAAEGATSLVRETVAQSRGMGDIDLGNVALDAAMAGLAEPVFRVIRGAFRAGMRGAGVTPQARQFTPEGTFTPEAIQQLDEAGITPDDLIEIVERVDDGELPVEEIPEIMQRIINEGRERGTSPVAAARVSEAAEEGVDLTAGEALQDVTVQQAEAELRLPTTEGEAARQARQQKVTQAAQLDSYGQRVLNQLEEGVEDLTETERGARLRDLVYEERQRRLQAVNEAYDAARQFGDDLPELNLEQLANDYRSLVSGSGIEPSLRNGIEEILARYGVIGEVRTGDVPTSAILDPQGRPIQTGEAAPVPRGTSVTVDFDGRPINVPDGVTPLTVENAENMRQELNRLFNAQDTRGAVVLGGLKSRLDDLVEETLTNASPQSREAQARMVEARDMFRELRRDFNDNQILDTITARVVGNDEFELPADAVIQALGLRGNQQTMTGRKNLASLRQLIDVLGGENSTAASRRSLNILRFEVMRDLLDAANVNRANPNATPTLSGSAFNRAVQRFGQERFDLLFPGGWGDDVRRFQRILGNATVPMRGVQTAGSAPQVNRLFNQLANMTRKLPRMGGTIPYAAGKLDEVAQAATNADVLRGIESGTPAASTALQNRDSNLLQLWLAIAPSAREAATGEEVTEQDIERANR